jgi:Domain of unknown function (DUF4214)/RTX calcium-binding nonapeptide repeat (4 copies)
MRAPVSDGPATDLLELPGSFDGSFGHTAFNSRVVLNPYSPVVLDASFLAAVQSNVEAALRYIGTYFQGLGTFTLQINFDSLGSNVLAEAQPNGYMPSRPNADGIRLLTPTWLPLLQTGKDPNGPDTPEGLIVINTDFRTRFWFDPTPDDRSDHAPAGKTDFLAVITHEIGHILGFDGLRKVDGSFANDARTVYDLHTVIDVTGAWYDSPAVHAVTGGRVAIDTTHGDGSKWYHLADPTDIMYWQENSTRTLSLVDLAILHDQGLVSAIRLDGNNVWFGTEDKDDVVTGGRGDDLFFGLGGNDTFAGGGGFDTVGFAAARGQAAITRNADGSITVVLPDGISSLRDIDALRFTDRTIFSVTGEDATIARLYSAAFARAPDPAGLAVQVNALHAGLTQQQLAQNFINSAEFVSRYGVTPNDGDFVRLLYRNVLSRDPDPGGYQWQLDALAHGLSRPQMLLNFADSAENKTKVTGDWLLA